MRQQFEQCARRLMKRVSTMKKNTHNTFRSFTHTHTHTPAIMPPKTDFFKADWVDFSLLFASIWWEMIFFPFCVTFFGDSIEKCAICPFLPPHVYTNGQSSIFCWEKKNRNALLLVEATCCRFVYYLFSFGGVNRLPFVLLKYYGFLSSFLFRDSFFSIHAHSYAVTHRIPVRIKKYWQKWFCMSNEHEHINIKEFETTTKNWLCVLNSPIALWIEYENCWHAFFTLLNFYF